MLNRKTQSSMAVLIEPYWNVKYGWTRPEVSEKSINRTILECKDVKKQQVICQKICINRTILECKVEFLTLGSLNHLGSGTWKLG